jgi:hypothetical protein
MDSPAATPTRRLELQLPGETLKPRPLESIAGVGDTHPTQGADVPPFPKPRFEYDYDTAHEVAALRHYIATEPGRMVPAKGPDTLLLVTWNIANSASSSAETRTTG